MGEGTVPEPEQPSRRSAPDQPVNEPARARPAAGASGRWRSLAIYAALPILAGGFAFATIGVPIGGFVGHLPLAVTDVTYSFLRMIAAYFASLGFALAYGYYAAVHRTGERVMIPVLDILQSVPILGFFPIAIVFFVQLTPHSALGANIASVFLIFTSMAWNMVFGVYESLKTLPGELKEAAETFGARGLTRFRRVLFPATVNRLVYNSVLSWTAGWFFLVEAEIFTTNQQGLQGIGSYLWYAAQGSNGSAFVAGIVVLVVLIALLDFAVWRPLGRWAERFRYDQSPSGEGVIETPHDPRTRFRRAAEYVTRGVRTGATRLTTPFVQLAAIAVRPIRRPSELRKTAAFYLGVGAILVISWLILIAIIVATYHVFSAPISSGVRHSIELLPLAMGESAGRVVAAYAICLAIAMPLAIYFSRHAHAARTGLPIVEVVASFPATALFPVIIFELVPYLSAEGAAILMLMTGMLWYLFFNLLSGVRSLPPDLEEAARSYGVTGRKFLTRVLLPGVFPALITGSITAFGGGWNTLIVAEYLNVGPTQSINLTGIGQSIDIGYALGGAGLALMAAAILTLVVTVVAVNEIIWKPLYRRAVEKYRYD